MTHCPTHYCTVQSADLYVGDARRVLYSLPNNLVRTCVTSPPYFGLRDYGGGGLEWADGSYYALGLEPTPEMYVAHLVEIMRDVRRVLADDGTLWLNIGDSYAGSGKGPGGQKQMSNLGSNISLDAGGYFQNAEQRQGFVGSCAKTWPDSGIKAKDLIGIPWMVAFALRADGWYLRQDIIWAKPNPMPESVRDRCTRSHEYIFMLSKSRRYFYDAKASDEPSVSGHPSGNGFARPARLTYADENGARGKAEQWQVTDRRNRRDVWTVTTSPYKGAHFATFPPKLIEPCILAGSEPGDIILDPFGGAGTTSLVATQLGRRSIYIDQSKEYADLAIARLRAIDTDPQIAVQCDLTLSDKPGATCKTSQIGARHDA